MAFTRIELKISNGLGIILKRPYYQEENKNK
jgi:hypothetical protein